MLSRPLKVVTWGTLALAATLAVVWRPARAMRQSDIELRIERAIAQREVQVSPAELSMLLHNWRVSVAIFDLRDESAFNVFHLTDSKRLVRGAWEPARALPPATVKILITDREEIAAESYRAMARLGVSQLYWLEGGMPAWLQSLERDGRPSAVSPWLEPAALGGRQRASHPDAPRALPPGTQAKIKLRTGGAPKGGGCGG